MGKPISSRVCMCVASTDTFPQFDIVNITSLTLNAKILIQNIVATHYTIYK